MNLGITVRFNGCCQIWEFYADFSGILLLNYWKILPLEGLFDKEKSNSFVLDAGDEIDEH